MVKDSIKAVRFERVRYSDLTTVWVSNSTNDDENFF